MESELYIIYTNMYERELYKKMYEFVRVIYSSYTSYIFKKIMCDT